MQDLGKLSYAAVGKPGHGYGVGAGVYRLLLGLSIQRSRRIPNRPLCQAR